MKSPSKTNRSAWGAVLLLAVVFGTGNVWCESDGYLHIQGKTLFPLGFYELPKDDADLKRMAEAGVNLIRCGSRTDLDRVANVGAFGWLPLDLAQGATDDLRAKVASVADHPALAVWEGPDEIVWNFTAASSLYRQRGIHKKAGAWKRRDPEAVAYAEDQAKRIMPNMRAAVDAIRQADTLHRPVWINEARDSDGDYVRQYLGFVDITGCDLYPVKETKRDPAAIGEAVRDWRVTGEGRPVWMVLQAFSWDELGEYYGAKKTVYPSFAESRFMAYDAIANGAVGLCYWGSNYSKSGEFRQSIFAVVSELSHLQAFLVSPEVSGLKASLGNGEALSDSVKVCARNVDGHWVLLLVNENRHASFDVVIKGLNALEGKDLSCLYEPETVSVHSGTVAVHIEPLGVKLFATERDWESTMREGRDFTGASDRQEATAEIPKFCNVILHNQGRDSIVGIHRFVDGLKQGGLLDRVRLTFILNGEEPNIQAEEQTFFKGLQADGHEMGIERMEKRASIAQWLDTPESAITTLAAQLFGDADVEQQASATQTGFQTCANACVEGDSLAEFWDIPHNWEGAPMFPYWVQWNREHPLLTARTNRELDQTQAMLELQWATRTLYHNYDRFPLPQCWHFGEPLKKKQWRVGQLVHHGENGGWWRDELEQYEANARNGLTPYLYINTASEGNIFTPNGPWSPMLDTDEALECAIDLVRLFLDHGWTLCTCQDFTKWFTEKWPCPKAPSMLYVMNDTLDGRKDRDGKVITGHGRLLHAETEHFQICDPEDRMAPEMIVAYDLRTPNLLRNGYTFANPAKWNEKESWDGHYASTTGNALFWSPSEPLKDVDGVPYFAPYKKPECRERTFTLYLGDDWHPYQFVPGRLSDVQREGDCLSWTKEMAAPVPGTDVRLMYHHVLDGPVHRVRVEVLGDDAVGRPVHLRLCPYFHQGWDHKAPDTRTDDRIPDAAIVGQERNVFARAQGHEFAYSESNEPLRTEKVPIPIQGMLSIYNRNPGQPGGSYDDNPAMNRGFTLRLENAPADAEFVDLPGPNLFVTVMLHFGEHKKGAVYEFSFEYQQGTDG